jgi:hypothetical protein
MLIIISDAMVNVLTTTDGADVGDDNIPTLTSTSYGQNLSTLIGRRDFSSDRPKMCFNAKISWHTGWYKDKEVTVGGDSLFGNECFDSVLHGIGLQKNDTLYMLVKIVNN